MQTKHSINTMQQNLAEKVAEAPTDTLTDSLAEVKAQKVGETLKDVKRASLFSLWSRRYQRVDAKTVGKTLGDVEAKQR